MSGPVSQPTDPINTHKKVFPSSLAWHQPKVASEVITRDRAEINSIEPVYAAGTGNNRIRIRIPNDSVYDPQKGYLSFDVNWTQPAPNQAWVSNGIYTLFRRVVLRAPDILEENREYGLWQSWLFENLTKIGASVPASIWGFGSVAQRQANANAGTTHYTMPIQLGMFKHQVFPAKYIKQECWLELELNDLTRCLEGVLTNVSFTVTNVKLRLDAIYGEPYLRYVESCVNGGGLNFGYKGYEYYQTPSWSGTFQPLQIPNRTAAVDNFIILFQTDTYMTLAANLDKFLTWGKFNLNTWQMKREGVFWPQQPVQATTGQHESYLEYLRALDCWHVSGVWKDAPLIDYPTYDSGNRFSLCVEVNPHQGDGLISPKGTSGYNVDPIINLQFNPAPGATIIAHVLVPTYITMQLNSNGRFAKAV